MSDTAEKQLQNVSHTDMANVIRVLAMDAVERANSGHPGMPMGMADIATVLFTKFLKFDPSAPKWADRDRFIVSNGHGSMLLYALNYLTGYENITLDELKNFRQLHSKTPGHPEYDLESGIETTTGPLGQGIGNAVGMAVAEHILADRFGRDFVNHYTYVFAGDGCLMEGISHEASSLAGHLQLGKLIVFYDDNKITIDGATDLSFSEDVLKRYESYGWCVQQIDGHDEKQITDAIAKAQLDHEKPSLIACRTRIGYGSPAKENTSKAHGSPLGADEITATRAQLGWAHAPFEIPDEILSAWRDVGAVGMQERKNWAVRVDSADGETRALWQKMMSRSIAPLIEEPTLEFKKRMSAEKPKVATRKASGQVLEYLVPAVPQLIGGSADLTGSNLTLVQDMGGIAANDFSGRYVYYGIREHAMAAMMNGMALHHGVIPYGGTFLTFTDYCRPSIRLSALMKQRVVYVMTHDSIGLGEDGPTHQPVEHLAALRAIPNLNVFRPADVIETAECWQLSLNATETPSILALTRQGLPTVREAHTDENLCAKGAYVLIDHDAPQVDLFASGSEVEIAIAAHKKLAEDGIAARVISVPCFELFFAQEKHYQKKILDADTVKVGIEAAIRQGWGDLIGRDGIFIGMDGFGDSAPIDDLYAHFGITADAVVSAVQKAL